MIGRVVSTKMNKTATVLVERTVTHPLYQKTFIRSKKYLVASEDGIKEGDIVEIVKIRPISKRKHWQAVKVVGKDLAAITAEKLKAGAQEIIAEVMPEEKTEKELSNKNQELSNKKKTINKKKEKAKKEVVKNQGLRIKN